MLKEQKLYFQEYLELRNNPLADQERISELETTLIQMNQGLIYLEARKIPSIWAYEDEIRRVGNSALLTAIRKYDPAQGDFAPYALCWIRSSDGLQGLHREHLCECLKIPHNAFVQYLKEKREMSTGKILEMSKESECIDSAANKTIRFGRESSYEGEFSLDETLPQTTYESPIDVLERLQMAEVLSKAILTLSDKEQNIIHYLYGLNEDEECFTLRTTGEIMHISHERVRQLRDLALSKLSARLPREIFSDMC